MIKPLIYVKGLYHTYQAETHQARQALLGVDFEVKQGEIAALIGRTGSGKSTLLQHLNGLYIPREGDVWVDGKNLKSPKTDLREIRRTVGLVFQRPGEQLFEQYAGDDIAYGPRLSGLEGRELSDRVRWAMNLVGLSFEEYKDRPTFSLSGGERRKVGLAGVVALRPRVLLLDEPTAGLDPSSRRDLKELLIRLNGEGMTLVLAAHDMEIVAELAGRVTVLERGRVVLSGSPGTVFQRIRILRSLGLDAPPTVLLMDGLRRRGWKVPLDVLNEKEAERIIRKAAVAMDKSRKPGAESSE